MLDDIWKSYLDGDYQKSLQMSVETLCKDAPAIDLLHLIGLSMMKMERHDEGVHFLKTAILFRPGSPHIYVNAAHACEQCGRIDDLICFSNAGLIDFPNNLDLLLLRGNAHIMKLEFDLAKQLYERILQDDPNHVQCLINLGNIARGDDDFETAENFFKKAEQLEPELRDIKFARATLLSQQGDNPTAKTILETLPRNDVDAQFLLSLIHLTDGDYETGFQMFKSRSQSVWYRHGNFVHPIKPFDHWSEAKGKKIAVMQEGGLGDLIMFGRYLPMIAEVADSVTLFCDPAMHRLLRHNLPNNVVIKANNINHEPELFHYVTTDEEMPHHFRTSIDTIPIGIPYIKVPDELISGCFDRIKQEPKHFGVQRIKHVVGLCWAGGSRDALNQRNYDVRRSISLELLEPLKCISKEVRFVSLQKGAPVEQMRESDWVGFGICQHYDMLDTAIMMTQMDLVITVDTSMAHLAGAMGKPVWILSRFDHCWRMREMDTPWYPQAKVFTQKKYKDWSYPLEQLQIELKEWIKK